MRINKPHNPDARKLIGIVSLLHFAMVSPLAYATDKSVLTKEFLLNNTICMENDSSIPEISAACDRRDIIYKRLNKIDVCLGPENMPFHKRVFMSCGMARAKESIRIYGLFGAEQFKTGETVSAKTIKGRLYLNKACDMPIREAKSMRYLYWTNGSMFRTGCWFPTLDGGFTFIYSNGEIEHQPLLVAMPRASLNPDGSAMIVEHDFDSETAVKKAMESETSEFLRRRQHGEY